jgi:AsmA protein
MKRSLRLGLIAAAVLIALGLGAVALPFLIPMSAYKAKIEAAGTRATGRALKIEGPLRIAFFPSPGIDAETVTLANVPDGRAEHLAEARSVHVALRLMPLLSGRIDIAAIALAEPQVHFEVNRDGEANWTLTRLHSGQTHAGHIPSELHIESITIADGRITYQNTRSEIVRSLDHVDASFALPVTDRSVSAKGSFVERATPFGFAARLGDTHTLLAGDPVQVSLALDSEVVTSNFKGTFSRNGDSDGDLALDTPSLRNLIALFGRPVKVTGGLGHLSLRAHIARRPHLTALSHAQLSLDGATVRGDLSIATAERVPDLTGRLAIDRLDLNPYLGSPHRHQGPHEEGWSTKPIRLDVLHAVNADLVLGVGSLDVRHLSIQNAKLHVTLHDARLSAEMAQVALYGGEGSAHLEVDASGPDAVFSDRIQFRHVDAGSFLSDTIGVDRITGTAALDLSAAAHGDNADAIMHTLSGKGAITLSNGQLHGVSLGDIAHTVEAVLHGSAISDEALTSFATMGGSFAIDHGVLETQDFHLASAVLVESGEGQVDLGNRMIDFRIVPRAVLQQPDESAPDNGENGNGRYGVPVPVHIQGPWSHIRFGANFSNVFTGILQNLESGRAPFKGMFGHTQHRPGSNGKKHKTVGDDIKNMLGIH